MNKKIVISILGLGLFLMLISGVFALDSNPLRRTNSISSLSGSNNINAQQTGSCCSDNSAIGPGCSDPVVQSCVCAQDSYCCTGLWDSYCVSEVNSFGCGVCVNTAPVIEPIPDQTIALDFLLGLEFYISASDAEGDFLNYYFDSNTATLFPDMFVGYNNETTGQFLWVPLSSNGITPGSYPVTVNVDDGNGNIASSSFTITVIPNSAPVVQAIPDQTIALDSFLGLELYISASDAEGNYLNYYFDSNTATLFPDMFVGANNDTTGVFLWTPLSSNGVTPGIYPVTIYIDDGYGDIVNVSFNINVVANSAPTIQPIPDQTVTLDSNIGLEFYISASDAEGDYLNYYFDSSTTNLFPEMYAGYNNETSGLLIWFPSSVNVNPGIYPVTIYVDDGNGNVVSSNFSINVIPNSAPIILPINNQTVYINGGVVDVFVNATDVDGDILGFSIDSGTLALFPDMTLTALDATSAQFQWVPSSVNGIILGSYFVMINVDDGSGNVVSTNFTINVLANTVPIVQPISDKNILINQILNVQVNATDADGDFLYYNIDSGNASAIIDTNTGLFTWDTTGISPGTYTFVINVSDYINVDVQVSFNVNVNSDITSPVTTDNSLAGWQNFIFNVTLSATDDNSGVNYTTYNLDNTGWINGTIIEITTEGNHSIQYYSVDNAGNVETIKSIYATLAYYPHATDDFNTTEELFCHNTNRTITLSESCGISGCNWTRYCLGQNCNVENGINYNGTIIVGEGTNYVRYTSKNNFGLIQNITERIFQVDYKCHMYNSTITTENETDIIEIGYELHFNSTINCTNKMSIRETNSAANSIFGVTSINRYLEIFAPVLEGNISNAIIKLRYNDSDVSTANVDESTLRLWFYNITSNTWVKVDSPNGGVDTVNNIVWANTTHFSTWGIFGDLNQNNNNGGNNNDGPSSGSGGTCTTTWTCSEWGSCINGIQERSCTKVQASCYANLNTKPLEMQNCVSGLNNNPTTTTLNGDTKVSSSGLTGAVIGAPGMGSIAIFIGLILVLLVVAFFVYRNKIARK